MKNLLFFLFVACAFPFAAQTTFSCTAAGTVCPCGGYGGSYAEYYAGYFNDVQTYFTTNTPGLTRNDPKIDFTADNSWGAIVPPATGSNASPDQYSTRWSGRMYLAAGTYTFWLTSDDASWFWLGGNSLAASPTSATAFINNGGLHSAATVAGVAVISADCLQDFKVHFGEQGGQNRCNLEYGSTMLGIARQAVPAAAFCPCMSNAVLPITLSKFYALANKDNIMIYWNTESEKDNRRFRVYKSGDGLTWSVLGEVAGAGTSSGARKYSMADNKPLPGLNYYYLEQTDVDGSSKSFDPMWVDFSKSDGYLKIFPNPFVDKFTVTSNSEWNDGDVLEVYNALGRQLDVPVVKLSKYNLEIGTGDLPPGHYIIKVKTAYQVIVRKLVKN